jgi:uncharacterized protein (DUF486 family)
VVDGRVAHSCDKHGNEGISALAASLAARHRQPDDSLPPEVFMPFAINPAYVWPVLLLLASNIFMTFAWYGHLKFTSSPLYIVIVASWGIAFFEYWLAVPANRIGHSVYSAAQLKTMQEVITLSIFVVFSVFWLKEPVGWHQMIGFALIPLGASFIFKG